MSALWILRVVSYLQSYKWLIINKIDISKGQWPPFISDDFLLLIFIAVYLHLPLRACWDVSTSLPLLELLISCIYHIQSVFFLSSRAAICFPFNRTGHGRLWNRENFLFGMQSLTRFFAKRFDLFLLWDETRLKLDATRTRHWALQSSFGGVVWIMVWYCFSGVVHSFQTNDGRRIPILLLEELELASTEPLSEFCQLEMPSIWKSLVASFSLNLFPSLFQHPQPNW